MRRLVAQRITNALALLFGLLVALGLDALWIEPDSLTVVEHPVVLDHPGALSSLRIAVIADLHGGARFIDEAKIAKVVALTNAARPDLILLTGDYVVTSHTGFKGTNHMPIETIVRLLRPLHAPLGVYAVLGNHDHWEDGPKIAAAFESVHIPVLDNTARAIPTPHGPLYLAGIGDDYTRHADPARALASVPAGQRALCFTHSPDVFPSLPETCLLTVAGHTHGGQVALPFIGRPIVPSRYGQRYAAGLVHEGDKFLFVATGIGTSIYPVRFRVPPEVSVIDLKP